MIVARDRKRSVWDVASDVLRGATRHIRIEIGRAATTFGEMDGFHQQIRGRDQKLCGFRSGCTDKVNLGLEKPSTQHLTIIASPTRGLHQDIGMNESTKPMVPPHFALGSTARPSQIGGQPTQAQDAEMLRRIQACVDACDGISTEELEEGIVQDMQRVLREVAPIIAEWSREQQR
jgi:hypothetical protein